MTRLLRLGIVTAAVTLCSVAAGASGAKPSPRARQVVDYLLDDWSKHMHSTGIALAMENLSLGQDDDLRLEVLEHFRSNTNLANNLKFWGANNYVLSNQERRIAKYLINAYDIDDRIPDLGELSRALRISEGELRERLAFLRRVGLLVDSATEPLGYALTEKYARWGGPLRHNFHTITIGDGKPFDVW